jgi:hypothetical protein
VVPEPVPISVAQENIAEYSLPAEVFNYRPPPDVVNCHFKNGDCERKIYCNIEVTKKELEQLRQLQEEARKSNVELYPSLSVMATRFLSRARGDAHKALKLMKETQHWRKEYFSPGPVCDREMLDDLRLGIIYFCGRDKDMRPAITVRPQRIPQQWYKEKRTDKLIRVLIFCMEYMIRYMIVPGKVENNCVIIDLKDVSMGMQNIAQLKEIYSVMSHHYIGRVFKFYICNLSPTLKRIGGWVTSILTDRQKQKLNFVDSVTDLREDFALHQLEEDLGGSRPLDKDFFPFPLPAGPFDAGVDGRGKGGGSHPRGHMLLTADGSRGKLWDTSLSRQANLELDYTPEAYELLKSMDLPVPPECLRAHLQKVGGNGKANGHDAATVSTAPTTSQPEQSPKESLSPAQAKVADQILPPSDFVKEEKAVDARMVVEDDVKLADELTTNEHQEVSNASMFSCCRPTIENANMA